MRETTIASQLSDTWSKGDVSPSDSLTNQAPCYKWRKLRLKKGSDFPRNRSKHGACKLGEYVYVCGGKDVSLSLKDFWRFSIEKGTWESLSYRGEKLPHLEDFSMVSHRTLLYIFGGEFSPSQDDTPLWIYHTDLFYLRKGSTEAGQPHPTGRRDHTVVVYRDSMFVYGGYIDLKGSSSEFWKFDFDSESWDLICPELSVDEVPMGRHGHTAVLYDKTMWIYGGMTNLVAKPELWTWHFGRCQWNRIRTRLTPPALVGHTADVIGDSMFVLGGEVGGQTQNTLWRFRFECVSWERVEFSTSPLPPLSHHCTVLSLPVLETSEDDQPNRSVSLPALRRQSRQTARLSDRPGTSPGNRMLKSESAHSGVFHNRISPNSGEDSGPHILVVSERNPEFAQTTAAKKLGGFAESKPVKREAIELSTLGDKDALISVNDKKPLLKYDETQAGYQETEPGEDNLSFVPSPATTGKSPFADQIESDCTTSKYTSQRQNKMSRDVVVNQARVTEKQPHGNLTDTKAIALKQLNLLKLEELPKRKSFSADDLVLEDLEQTESVAKLVHAEEEPVHNTENKSVNLEHSQLIQVNPNSDVIQTSFIEDHFKERAPPTSMGGNSTETAFSSICQEHTFQESSSHNQTTSPKRSISYIQKDTASIYVFGGRNSDSRDKRDLAKQPVEVWKCDIPLIS